MVVSAVQIASLIRSPGPTLRTCKVPSGLWRSISSSRSHAESKSGIFGLVLLKRQDDFPTHFGKSLAFFTSAGAAWGDNTRDGNGQWLTTWCTRVSEYRFLTCLTFQFPSFCFLFQLDLSHPIFRGCSHQVMWRFSQHLVSGSSGFFGGRNFHRWCHTKALSLKHLAAARGCGTR